MKRAGNCVNAKMNYINFHGDCLVFDFAKYKVHQNGEKYFGPWHVYKKSIKTVVVFSAIIIAVFVLIS